MRIITMAMANYRDKADRLELQCRKLGYDFTRYDLPEIDKRVVTWNKPWAIKTALYNIGEPVWWVDADDEIIGQIKNPVGDFDFGFVKNPELSVINTDLRIAGCIHFWKPTQKAFDLLDFWASFRFTALNDHRGLTMAIDARVLNVSIADVTSCITGSYKMTERSNRPVCYV
jgi:hypothetical protein